MPFQKGHAKIGGKEKGTKNKSTLLKEERRAIFDEITSERWKEVIYDLPPQYIADQFMGKAPDKIEHTIGTEEPSERIKELANKLLVLQSTHEKRSKDDSGATNTN